MLNGNGASFDLQIRYAEDLFVVNQGCCLLIVFELMPTLTSIRDINTISIERLLHYLHSGKLLNGSTC